MEGKMQIKIFEGMLPNEHLICEVGNTDEFLIPQRKELICAGDRSNGEDTVYEVINVLYDYAYYSPNGEEDEEPEIDIFVKKYEWEPAI